MAHILVIDDESELVLVLRKVLEEAGHQVLTALDSKTAFELYDANPVDLVITDILMPDQDGLEMIRLLQRRPERAVGRSKILAISGGGRYHMMEVLRLARGYGADATLAKPFTEQELLSAVNTLLEA